jgi:hypothetical protein
MNNRQKKQQEWLKNNSINTNSVRGLIDTLSVDSGRGTFKSNYNSTISAENGKPESVPGLSLQYPVRPDVARLIASTFEVKDMSFPSKTSFPKEDGRIHFKVESTDDYTSHIMRNPRNVAGIQIEAYSRYKTLTGALTGLAKSGVLQMTPDERLDLKNSDKISMPYDEDIISKIKDAVTGNDFRSIVESYESGIAERLKSTEPRPNLTAGQRIQEEPARPSMR